MYDDSLKVLFCVGQVGSNTKRKSCALNVDQGSFQDLNRGTEKLHEHKKLREHEKSQITKLTLSCIQLQFMLIPH